MKRKLLVLLFIVAMMTGCSNQFADLDYENEQKIAGGSNTVALNGVEQDIKDDRFVCKAAIDGMEMIWSYDAEAAEAIEVYYLMNVKKGKAKIVLIKPDGTLETIVEQGSGSKAAVYTSDVLYAEQGENRIKLVASKGTEVEFDLTISKGNFRKLGF